MRSVHHCLYATALITRSIADSNVRCINSKRQLEFGNGTSCETHWTIRYSLSHVANTLTQSPLPTTASLLPTLKLFLPMATCSGSVATGSTLYWLYPLLALPSTTGSTLYWLYPLLALPSTTGSTLYWLYPLLALPSTTGSTLYYWLYPLLLALPSTGSLYWLYHLLLALPSTGSINWL